jgi:hypothetical protein
MKGKKMEKERLASIYANLTCGSRRDEGFGEMWTANPYVSSSFKRVFEDASAVPMGLASGYSTFSRH